MSSGLSIPFFSSEKSAQQDRVLISSPAELAQLNGCQAPELAAKDVLTINETYVYLCNDNEFKTVKCRVSVATNCWID